MCVCAFLLFILAVPKIGSITGKCINKLESGTAVPPITATATHNCMHLFTVADVEFYKFLNLFIYYVKMLTNIMGLNFFAEM